MSKIITKLVDFFSQYSHQPIVIAYSGGVDSQVLLHALAQLIEQKKISNKQISNKLIACHVNHGLSENAMQWQSFAQQQCQQLNINFRSYQVNIKAQAQHSLEALARDARYQVIKNLCDELVESCLVVTGHHSDDQSETFLLALKRGAGVKGLSGMAKSSPFGVPNNMQSVLKQHILTRPLLDVSRAEIMQYAQKHNLQWIEDESNNDTRFDRNFLRHNILPLLKNRWPSINQTIARSSQHCQSAQALLDELAEQDLLQCEVPNKSEFVKGVLNVTQLKALSLNRFNNFMRYFLMKNDCLMPSTEQLLQVFHQLSAATEKAPEIKVGQFWLRRYAQQLFLTIEFADLSSWKRSISFDELHLESTKLELPDKLGMLTFNQNDISYIESLNIESSNIESSNIESLNIEPLPKKVAPKTIYIQAPKKGAQVSIRFSHTNPKCLPEYRQKSRALKKVLQELEIPTWQRKRIPFLYYDNVFVAALGHFICQPFTCLPSLNGEQACNEVVEKGKPSIEITWLSSLNY